MADAPSPPTTPPPAAAPRREENDRSRLWIVPLLCLLAAILLSLTAFWAMAATFPRIAPPDGGGGRGLHADGGGANPQGGGSELGGTQPEQPGTGSDPAPHAAGQPDAPGGLASTLGGSNQSEESGPSTGTPALDEIPPVPELGFGVSLDLATPAQPAAGDADTGGGGPATFFGQPGRGSRFVYVIDRSGSMEGGRFQDACFELIRSIRALRPHESFYVIFYDSRAHPMSAPALLRATPTNQEAAVEWIRSMSVGGGTDPTEAMLHALRVLRPDTIWLLSDGQFDIRVTDAIREANPRQQVQINTIAFHDTAGEVVLRRIAEENDGDYRFVPAGQ